MHQQSFDEAVEALPAEHDPATIEGRQNEARFREAFMQAMDAAQVEALIFPTWAQLPAINGDRNTQLTDDPQPAPHAGLDSRGRPAPMPQAHPDDHLDIPAFLRRQSGS